MKLIRVFKNLLRTNETVCMKTYNQLHNMTDRDLQDIGICRGDIRRVASSKPGEIERRSSF